MAAIWGEGEGIDPIGVFSVATKREFVFQLEELDATS